MVIPEAIRVQAQIKAGDEMEVGFAHGLVVLRKRVPLTAARVRSLLQGGHDLPEQTPTDEAEVARALERVRQRVRK